MLDDIKKKMEYYCVYRERTHKEIETKLYSYNITASEREILHLHLIEQNFVNEERYAKSYVRGKHHHNQWGREKIKGQLRYKGISARLITEALQEIDENEYLQTLQNLAENYQRTNKESNPYKNRQKLIRYLIGKGYEYELIEQLEDFTFHS